MQRKGTAAITFEQKCFWGLMACIVAFACLYMYFICASIVNVIERGQIEKDIAATSAHIGDLEAQYLAKKESIDYGYAQRLGFVPAPAPQYIARANTGSSLTYNR
jgi:hypothetical protein